MADVECSVAGIPGIGPNGGPAFQHSEAFSFQIATGNQMETDRLWGAIVQTAASKACAAGARTAGASPGRSLRAR